MTSILSDTHTWQAYRTACLILIGAQQRQIGNLLNPAMDEVRRFVSECRALGVDRRTA